MTTPTIDALAHRTARLSRRRSLFTLGGAVLAAATVVAAEPGLARKRRNNNKKNKNRKKNRNGGKGNGGICQKQEQERCSNDAAACKSTLQPLCNADNIAECTAIRTCCEECSAGGFLSCLAAAQQV
ncbi:MAG: hypothetical protein U0Z70_00745 [Thermomicrobiales bacterium]